jgi:hypothetical protein
MSERLSDERLHQLAFDEYVCSNENERVMAAELLKLRPRLLAASNDLIEVRGALSPNGGSRAVPPEVSMQDSVLPAVEWLIARVAELEAVHGARIGYIIGYLGDLGDWVIPEACIPWADPADAENARADAAEHTVPGLTPVTLTVFREERHV